MAVTDPNYELKESLSSQICWKYSARTRPPQLAKERAYLKNALAG